MDAPNETLVRLSDYDYVLPDGKIAQQPVEPRDSARLMVVPRSAGEVKHRVFRDLPDLLRPDDLLVVNETRVTAVRLFGSRQGGGAMEALLLRPALEVGADCFDALVRPGSRLRDGDQVQFASAGLTAEIVRRTPDGGRTLRFEVMDGKDGESKGDVAARLDACGQVPLPPYITAPLGEAERYQTVYNRVPGSAAAPTAGLHFTPDLLARLDQMGVQTARVRLDVGLGTFRPVKVDDVRAHTMHHERFAVSEAAAQQVNTCTGRVIAVGTTSVRALETCARAAPPGKRVRAMEGETDIFLYPGHSFRAVDGLITNFHQPHSTLLLLVAAFAGREQMRSAYKIALRDDYRFLSFGDAMLVL